MGIESFQRCTDTGEYITVHVLSQTEPNTYHEVIVIDPEDPSQSVCTCKGFAFRGHCRHIDVAHTTPCRWETGDPEQQTEHQRHHKICPRCGNQTEWIMEITNA